MGKDWSVTQQAINNNKEAEVSARRQRVADEINRLRGLGDELIEAISDMRANQIEGENSDERQYFIDALVEAENSLSKHLIRLCNIHKRL